MRSQLLVALFVVAVSINLIAEPEFVLGQQYRVETDVFRDESPEPFVKTLTLFTNGLVYDFSLTGDEITFYDLNRNRFVLMNVKEKVKSTLTTQEVLMAVADLKAKTTDKNPLFYFAANPNFESNADEGSMVLEMKSFPLTYEVTGNVPQKKSIVREYQGFADWSIRLTSLQTGFPPFARMEVNRAVADLGWTPESTKLTMRRKNGLFPAKEAKFRSAHRYNWTLSKSDQQRIDEVGNYMASFADLPFVEYRNAGKPLTRAQR